MKCTSNTAFVKIRGFNPPVLQQNLMGLTVDTVFMILRGNLFPLKLTVGALMAYFFEMCRLGEGGLTS